MGKRLGKNTLPLFPSPRITRFSTNVFITRIILYIPEIPRSEIRADHSHLPGKRLHFARINSKISGFFLCGMILEPVVYLSTQIGIRKWHKKLNWQLFQATDSFGNVLDI